MTQVPDKRQPDDAGGGASISRRSIARSFGRAAVAYDGHAALQRRVADTLTRELPDTAPERMLDLGCGTGYCSGILRRRYPEAGLLALDIALPMLQRARASRPDLPLLCADAEALPLADASIDLLVSSLTIQWCANPARLFAELRRIASPGARLLLSTFGPASLRELREAWARVDDYTHVNDFVAGEELRSLARQAGLHCELRRELLSEDYASLYELSRSLKGIGAHNMNRSQAPGLTSPGRFRRAAGYFAAGRQGAIPVSWEIYYLQLRPLG